MIGGIYVKRERITEHWSRRRKYRAITLITTTRLLDRLDTHYTETIVNIMTNRQHKVRTRFPAFFRAHHRLICSLEIFACVTTRSDVVSNSRNSKLLYGPFTHANILIIVYIIINDLMQLFDSYE